MLNDYQFKYECLFDHAKYGGVLLFFKYLLHINNFIILFY